MKNWSIVAGRQLFERKGDDVDQQL